MAHDPKWEMDNWFDWKADYGQLRSMQYQAGPLAVDANKELFMGDLRQRLLEKISLMALVCGSGKTLLMVATMLHINCVVTEHLSKAPRCRRVLWFVKERGLAFQLYRELPTEVIRYGLHHRKPTVQVCSETGDLDADPGHNDITISCPHALWEKTNQRRSEAEIEEILSKYDVIIWDECDFAIDQIKRLIRLAPHALKFGLTASPIDHAGDLLRECFVLAGIAGYQDVFEKDRCLKRLLPWDDMVRDGYVRAFSHDGFTQLVAGVETPLTGQHRNKHSLPGAWAAVSAAIADCKALEADMRERWDVHWYSPHILVACDNRQHADAVTEYINDHLKQHRRDYPAEDGWRALPMYDELAKDKATNYEPAEKSLFHKNTRVVHPFMRAKENEGRCDAYSSRILVVVDMAIRGMNNWPILYIVDIKRSGSVNTQVQLLGRPGRLPMHLRDLHSNPLFGMYCTARYYFPQSDKSDDPDEDGERPAASAMEQAFDFVLNMEEKFIDAEFPDWTSLLAPDDSGNKNATKSPPGSQEPFTLADRLAIDMGLNRRLQEKDGKALTVEEIETIINGLPGELPDKRRERAREHIRHMTDTGDRKYRRQFVYPPTEPLIAPVATEKPSLDPSLEMLRAFLVGRSLFKEMAQDILAKLDDDPLWRQALTKEYIEDNKQHYLPRPKIFQLHSANDQSGILTKIGGQVQRELLKAGAIVFDRSCFQKIMTAVGVATKELTGVDDTSNDRSLDHPGYHYALVLAQSQRRIKARAVGLLIRWGVLEGLSNLYSDVIDDD